LENKNGVFSRYYTNEYKFLRFRYRKKYIKGISDGFNKQGQGSVVKE
jgi:hypothetical protein